MPDKGQQSPAHLGRSAESLDPYGQRASNFQPGVLLAPSIYVGCLLCDLYTMFLITDLLSICTLREPYLACTLAPVAADQRTPSSDCALDCRGMSTIMHPLRQVQSQRTM